MFGGCFVRSLRGRLASGMNSIGARTFPTARLQQHQTLKHLSICRTYRKLSYSTDNSVYALRHVARRASVADTELSSGMDNELDDLDGAEGFEEFEVEEIVGRQISVGEAEWGKVVYSSVLECLKEEEFEELELYLFKASQDQFVEIRIDKVTNRYGSPSLDDIERLAKSLNSRVAEQLGEETAGEIEIGISSPGADRPVEWHELKRFSDVPLEVTMYDTGQEESTQASPVTQIVLVDNLDSGSVSWKLADVKANSPGKGRRLNKKMREKRWECTQKDIISMNIHVEL